MAGPVRLSDLLLARVTLSWSEALALVQAVAGAGVLEDDTKDIAGSLGGLALHPDGTIHARPGASPAVSAGGLASLLRYCLPEPGSGQGAPPPGALRYTISRALREVEAPPIVSVRQLSATLARFEREDRNAALSAVYARWAARQAAPAPAPAPAPASPAAARPAIAEELPADLPLQTAAIPEDDFTEVVLPPPAARMTRHPGFGRRLAQLVAALVLIAAGALVGYMAIAEWPRVRSFAQALLSRMPALTSRTADRENPPSSETASRPETEEQDARPTGQGTTGQGTALSSEPAGRPSRTGARTEEPKGNTPPPPALESRAPAPTSGMLPPGTIEPSGEADEAEVNREGRVVQALDAGRRPIFSPSFAFDGSAVFFHQDTATGSGLREAQGDPSGEMLHVVSLLDDGARNYHPRLSPDGKMVAFDSDRDGVRGVYVSARDGTNVRRVSGPGYAAVPSWSPDGSRLAFIRAEPGSAGVWNVWVLEMASGEVKRLTSHRFGQPWGASWFPDGRRICYSHEDRLVVLETTTGTTSIFPSPRKGRLVRTPAVSPDGRKIIFQLYRDGAWLLDLGGGSMRRVLADPTAEEFSWAPDGRRVAFHSRRDGQWGVWVMASE